jgi:phosphatidylserine/phosphatidylglycerophosphate/cardiolipin synthase-like enzyme
MKKITLFVLGTLASIFAANAATITIAAARAAGTGIVTIAGIATNGAEFGSARYMQDNTGGIDLYSSTLLASVNRGDSLLVTGTLSRYNNLLELAVTTVTVVSSGHNLPAPIIHLVSQYADSIQSHLIEIDSVTFANAGSTFSGSTNYTITATGLAGQIRINAASSLVGQLIPTGTVKLTGILSQFCSAPATGCTSGWQLLLRDYASDIHTGHSIVIVSQVLESAITQTGFTLSWNTNINGSTQVMYGTTTALGQVQSGTAGVTVHSAVLTGLSPNMIYYAKAFSVAGTDTAFSGVRVFATGSSSSGFIRTYFTRGVDTTVSTGTIAKNIEGHVHDTLVAYINKAQQTIDLAVYNWDQSFSNAIAVALNNAFARGVRVRVIYDGSTSCTAPVTLVSGIPRIASPQGAPYAIMHDKFVIFDANSSNPNTPLVWGGSTNWTFAQLTSDANNVFILQDQSIAKGFTLEFNQMWGDTGMVFKPLTSKFGPMKTDCTPHEYLSNGKRIEVYFSPSDGTNSEILRTIATANTDLEFAINVFTRSDLATAIVAAKATAAVFGATDDSTASTQWSTLKAGLGVNMHEDHRVIGIMHDKYMIVDQSNVSSDPLVLTGSHNWSNAADQTNDEHTVVIHDATVANLYYQNFMYIVKTEIAAGILEQSSSISLSLFPNPNDGNFTVKYELKKNEEVNIVILDLSGRTVYETKTSGIVGINQINVKNTNLSKGTYLIRFQTQDGTGTRKLILN